MLPMPGRVGLRLAACPSPEADDLSNPSHNFSFSPFKSSLLRLTLNLHLGSNNESSFILFKQIFPEGPCMTAVLCYRLGHRHDHPSHGS